MYRDVGHFIRYYVEQYKESPPVESISSGLDNFDKLLGGGLIPGTIMTVAAKTGEGKTSFGLTTALNVAKNGTPVSILSFEMGMPAIHARLNQMITGVSSSKIETKSYVDKKEERAVDKGNEYLSKLEIIGRYCGDVFPSNIFELVEKQVEEFGIGLLIVDYIQLVSGDSDNQVRELEKAMGQLMKIAGTFRMPIISLAQYNRSIGEEPDLRNIQGSGSIEQNSSVVVLLKAHYDKPWIAGELYPFDFIIKKYRHGQTGTVVQYFNPGYARFENA